MVVDDLRVSTSISIPKIFHCCQEDCLNEWDELTKDEPNIYHLDIGCWWQLVHHGCEDRSHHQHCSQVYSYCCFKIEWFEEGCGICGQK